jgi:hypothetical protein
LKPSQRRRDPKWLAASHFDVSGILETWKFPL